MAELTYKEIAKAQATVTLLVNPGTPEQRAFWSCKADRLDQRNHAVAKAAAKYPGAPLAWLTHSGTTHPITTEK